MANLTQIVGEFEVHSPAGIRACFEQGIDPNVLYQGQPLIYTMINMYYRSAEFKHCIRAFVDYGLTFDDPVLLAVLMDDAVTLKALLQQDPASLDRAYSLDCTFTPLFQASLLHVCAEYNHVNCAQVLVEMGMDIDGKAGLDNDGFGGQTPIFHTVNQHNNYCLDMLTFLLAHHADLTHTVQGLIWGKGYDWETFIPSVNPISYAMMGLLRQFQRSEKQIYEVVNLLMEAAYGIDYTPRNLPNKYLMS